MYRRDASRLHSERCDTGKVVIKSHKYKSAVESSADAMYVFENR